MDVKQDAVNKEINTIDTIEIAGEFIMEQRHGCERRQRKLNYCSRYERRISCRRNARSNTIDIII
ncbi:hypothetical protein [Moritella yayanosii]|uniref:Uncharacterized protein n=1 Tax=Moritella yayanosii TaxID=69539 RepID=A0A330LZF0_9GAMM|nr:hypothetical protein [Moritella yayanosii]SQD79535.1 conserved protein of unknown function [Moritella yayanosii]